MITFANEFDLIEIRLAKHICEAAQWFAVPEKGGRLIPSAAADFISNLINARSLPDRVCFFDEYTTAFHLKDFAFSLPCDVGDGDGEYYMDLATLCDIISDDALWKRLVRAFLTSDMGRAFAAEFKLVKENRRALALLRIHTPGYKQRHVAADKLMRNEAEVAQKLVDAAPAQAATKPEKRVAARRARELKKAAKLIATEVREAWKTID